MLKSEVFEIRDLVSQTVHDLILVTATTEQEIITVNIFGKEKRLYAEELWDRRNSCKNFLNYIKEKINE